MEPIATYVLVDLSSRAARAPRAAACLLFLVALIAPVLDPASAQAHHGPGHSNGHAHGHGPETEEETDGAHEPERECSSYSWSWLEKDCSVQEPEPEVEPTSTGVTPEAGETDRGGRSGGTVVTVATVNINRYMGVRRINADRRKVLARRDVDVIGWQEADRDTSFFGDQPGWGTARHPGATGAIVSWRLRVFEFGGSRVVRLHGSRSGPTGARYTSRAAHIVTLEHRATGRKVTVINAHIVPKIEDPSRPGRPRHNLNSVVARRAMQKIAQLYATTPGIVMGTGDFNWDYRADSRVRHPKFVLGSVGQFAQSSYEALGTGNVRPTLGRARYVDYVFLGRHSNATFVGHQTLRGFHSDHRPLLGRIQLR